MNQQKAKEVQCKTIDAAEKRLEWTEAERLRELQKLPAKSSDRQKRSGER